MRSPRVRTFVIKFDRGAEMGLTDDEKAFYDALATKARHHGTSMAAGTTPIPSGRR